jgi:hypothetical protein
VIYLIKPINLFSGMITGAATGILRSIMVTPNNLADIIPVDVAINLVILWLSRRVFFRIPCFLSFFLILTG